MSKSTIELALRAAACKRWRWIPGMLVTAEGLVGVRLFYMHGGVSGGWWAGSTSGERVRLTNDDMRTATPILTDQATLGCLEAMAIRAHGPGLFVERNPPHWIVGVPSENGLTTWDDDNTDSYAEALVCALEATP